MKITYWYSKCLDDSDCYSIRAKTKKEAQKAKESHGEVKYGPILRIEVNYESGFDLLTRCLSESGILEESRAHYNAVMR